MTFKKLLITLMSLTLLSLSAQAVENPSIKGVYTRSLRHQFKFDGKTVEVIEFLSFYCITCYHFESSIPIIKEKFPKKLKWKTVVIYFGNGSPKPAEAYLLAEEAGKGEKMKKAIFYTIHHEKKDIGNVEVLESIGSELGLGFDFSRRLRAGDKAKNVINGENMAKEYNITATPTLIIAGNIMTTPKEFNYNLDAFRENIITILKSLLR